MYNHIFFTNVLRVLAERGMTKLELSEKSGVSISFLSDLTNGKGNPSLKVMESIAVALDVSLPYLLEVTDLDRASLEVLAGGKPPSQGGLPHGYVRVTAILPAHRAFEVQKWNDEAVKKIQQTKKDAPK